MCVTFDHCVTLYVYPMSTVRSSKVIKLDLLFCLADDPFPVLPDAGADELVDGALEGEGAALGHAAAPVPGLDRGDLGPDSIGEKS